MKVSFLILHIFFLLLSYPSWSQNNENLRVVKTPEAYKEALQKGEKVRVEGLVGRLLRGTNASDFQKLSPDCGRECVFFMDSKGLGSLTSLDQHKMLEAIGYPLKTIEELKQAGTEFKLVVSKPNDGIKLATWDNVQELIQKNYSPEVSKKVALALDQLKTMPFEALKSEADKFGFNFTSDRSKAGFMSADLLAKDPDFILKEGKLSKKAVVKARAFLFSILNLNELYAGDGYTRTPDGKLGVPEYISPNASIKDLTNNGAVVIDNPGIRVKSLLRKDCFSKLLIEMKK